MPALFVTGIGTDVGKTYVSAALIRGLRARGVAVDALKPVVSGFDPAAPEGSDPAVLLDALGVPLTPAALDRIAPFQFRAPLAPPMAAALEGRALDGAAVIALCRACVAEAGETLLLVEGSGGVMSPLDETRTMLDLAVALGAPAVLVAATYLGAISHTLTAALALASAGVTVRAIVVSESPPPAPSLEETLRALERHAPATPIVAVRRGEGLPAAWLDELSQPPARL